MIGALPEAGRRRLVVLTVLLAAVMAIAVLAFIGDHRAANPKASRPPDTSEQASPARSPGLQAVPPLTARSRETPVEQRVNHQLASGLTASGTIPAAEAARVPAPSYTGGWSRLPVAETSDAWARTYITRLLDIRFDTQSRNGLAHWIAAETAPELLPGIPPEVQDKISFLSLFQPAAVGGGQTPIPTAPAWHRAAVTKTIWRASGLLIQPDPTWSRLVASGWQPTDQRFAAEDVSGILTVTSRGHRPAVHKFSAELYVGSAHWHAGYGTVLLSGWKES